MSLVCVYQLTMCFSGRAGRTALRMNLSRSMMSGGAPPPPDHEPDDERADIFATLPATSNSVCNLQHATPSVAGYTRDTRG